MVVLSSCGGEKSSDRRGQTGQTGDKGDNGVAGPSGVNGLNGADGERGKTGKTGIAGAGCSVVCSRVDNDDILIIITCSENSVVYATKGQCA